MAAHPLHLNVTNGSEDAVLNARVPTPRSPRAELQLVSHNCCTLTVGDHDTLPLESFTSNHDGVQFRPIDGLPAPRERVGELGRLSGDATPAPTVVRLRGVLTTAISRDLLPVGPDLRCTALLRKGGTFEDHVPWRAETCMAEDALGVLVKSPGPAVVHPETSAGGIEDRPRGVVTLSCQSSHGLDGRAIQTAFNALKVGPPGRDRLHDLAVAGCDHEVVSILPPNHAARRVETSRFRLPP
eukprot:4513836-Amphidinium_carterae.2